MGVALRFLQIYDTDSKFKTKSKESQQYLVGRIGKLDR